MNKKSAAAADGPFAGRVFAEAGQVRHDGYVNNITSTYVDAINPIAAVKFARGKITKTGQRYPGLDQPHHEQRPSTALRHVAFARIPPVAASADGYRFDEEKRLVWKMRELIVQIGLPKQSLEVPGRGRLHESVVLDPDEYVAKLVTEQHARERLQKGLGRMTFYRQWPSQSFTIPLDLWLPAEQELAEAFIGSIQDQNTRR